MPKGYKHTREAREKIGAVHRGKKLSAEHRAGISAGQKGKQLSPEHRAKIGEAQRGPKNHMWLGGISREPYGWEWNEELRQEVRRRDGYKCQLCGVPQAECETALDVHHIDYDKKNSDPVNLVALCHSCNSRVNANRKHWTALFQDWAIGWCGASGSGDVQ